MSEVIEFTDAIFRRLKNLYEKGVESKIIFVKKSTRREILIHSVLHPSRFYQVKPIVKELYQVKYYEINGGPTKTINSATYEILYQTLRSWIDSIEHKINSHDDSRIEWKKNKTMYYDEQQHKTTSHSNSLRIRRFDTQEIRNISRSEWEENGIYVKERKAWQVLDPGDPVILIQHKPDGTIIEKSIVDRSEVYDITIDNMSMASREINESQTILPIEAYFDESGNLAVEKPKFNNDIKIEPNRKIKKFFYLRFGLYPVKVSIFLILTIIIFSISGLIIGQNLEKEVVIIQTWDERAFWLAGCVASATMAVFLGKLWGRLH